uniref:Uncharacterized protein n=1 Tax=Meloidogyne incognita TaxID=6306 RepID=A0A914M0U0_MELIC
MPPKNQQQNQAASQNSHDNQFVDLIRLLNLPLLLMNKIEENTPSDKTVHRGKLDKKYCQKEYSRRQLAQFLSLYHFVVNHFVQQLYNNFVWAVLNE